MKKRTMLVGASLGAAALVAAGAVAAFGGSFTNPEAGPLPEGVKVVTQQAYDKAFTEFSACMKDGGARLFGEREVGQVKEFSYMDTGQAVYDKCYVAFAPVDFQWQIAHSYESETFVQYRECLTDTGVKPGKDADTILAQVEESGLDIQKCFAPEG